MAKWRRCPEERPAQILEAALDVFARRGFAEATMDDIAGEAGITKGTIYLYFEGKRELLLAVVRAQLGRFMALLPRMHALITGDIEENARQLGGDFLGALMEPEVTKTIQVILAELQHLPEVKRLYQEEALPQANVQVAGFLKAHMDVGTFRQLDPTIATRCLFGMFMIFVLTQEILGASRITPMSQEAIVDTVTGIFFHGIMNRGTA